MARRRADDPPRNEFEVAMLLKKIDANLLSARWGKDVRRINQIRSKPKQIHIDAIQGIHKRRRQTPIPVGNRKSLMGRNVFEEIMFAKNLSAEYLVERWNLGVRRINQIRTEPETMHVDAIKGVPKYRKQHPDNESEDVE